MAAIGYSKPADLIPAEGRPPDGRGTHNCAERGVRTDDADRRASAGKLAETGVVNCVSLGLAVAGILTEVDW